MDNIYISAVNVLAWVWPLESLTPTSPDLTSTINPDTLAACAAALLAHPRWSPSAPPKDRFIRLEEEKTFNDLAMLLQAPTYWTRRWIVQELVLPRFVTLVFGTVHIPIAQVEYFFAALTENYRARRQREAHYGIPTLQAQRLPFMRREMTDEESNIFISMEREMKDVEMNMYELAVREHNFTKCMAARICAYRAEYRYFKQQRRGKIKLYEGLRYFHDFECSHPLDVVYSLAALVDPRERVVRGYDVEVIVLVTAVYKKLRSRVGRQRAFLYARYLMKRMEGDVEGVLERWFGDGDGGRGGGGGDRGVAKGKGGEALEIDLVIRKRAIVVSHLESIDELCEAVSARRVKRDFGNDLERPLPPCRPLLGFGEGRDIALDGFPDPTAIDEMGEVKGVDPAILSLLELPQFPEGQKDAGKNPLGSIPIQDANGPAEMDTEDATLLDGLHLTAYAPLSVLHDDYPHDDTQSAMPSTYYDKWGFEEGYKRKQLMDDLKTVLSDAFWDQPTRGPKFWERRLKRRVLGGYYTLIPGPATSKMRDDRWETDLSHRFFTANTPFSILGGYSICGVSEFPLLRGDEIWQIPGVEMALVVRKDGKDEYRVVSRAYICPATGQDMKKRLFYWLILAKLQRDEITGLVPSWDCLKCGTILGEKRVVRLDLPFLLELCR